MGVRGGVGGNKYLSVLWSVSPYYANFLPLGTDSERWCHMTKFQIKRSEKICTRLDVNFA